MSIAPHSCQVCQSDVFSKPTLFCGKLTHCSAKVFIVFFRISFFAFKITSPGARPATWSERFSRQQKRTCNNSTLLDVLSLALVTLKVLLVADAINPLGLSPEFCKPLLPRSHAPMALVHNAGKLKFGAEKKGKKRKNVFDQLDTLELAANGPREHI
jgi:hypothetical protein